MIKILLIGHGSFANRGCEAIVRGTVKMLHQAIPDASITLVSRTPEFDESLARMHGIKLDHVVPANGQYRRYSFSWLGKVVVHRIFNRDLTSFNFIHRRRYAKHHAVISIGGDNFTDDYGIAADCFAAIDCAKQMGAVTAIWGASIGPFSRAEEAARWAQILRRVDLITAREAMTVSYLSSLDVKSNVQLVADPAFWLEPSKPRNPLPSPGSERIIVGLGISDLLVQSAEYGEKYLSASAAFIKQATEDPRVFVRLVPHVSDGIPSTDDKSACLRAWKMSGVNQSVELLPATYTAAEFKQAISECDYFIGARTHSTIASLSTHVPTLSIAYSMKAFGINREFFGSENYVLPVRDVTAQSLWEKFSLLKTNRREIIATLQAKVPLFKITALQGAERLRELINNAQRIDAS